MMLGSLFGSEFVSILFSKYRILCNTHSLGCINLLESFSITLQAAVSLDSSNES